MSQPIDPVSAQIRLAELLGDDSLLAQAPASPAFLAAAPPTSSVNFTGNAFEDILAKTIQALDGVSQTEIRANQLISQYMQGQADLSEVMIAQAKMSVSAQLAVTVVSSAVSSFQQVTQIQI